MTAQELSGVFCEDLVAQELDNDTAYFEIPEEIRDFYNRKKGADSGAFFSLLIRYKNRKRQRKQYFPCLPAEKGICFCPPRKNI